MARAEKGRLLLPSWEEHQGNLPGGSDISDGLQKVSRAGLGQWDDGYPGHRAGVNKG